MLGVEFAQLYFRALDMWNDNPETPDARELLFRRAQDENFGPDDLGVNADINHDLALAQIATWRRLGFPGVGAQHLTAC